MYICSYSFIHVVVYIYRNIYHIYIYIHVSMYSGSINMNKISYKPSPCHHKTLVFPTIPGGLLNDACHSGAHQVAYLRDHRNKAEASSTCGILYRSKYSNPQCQMRLLICLGVSPLLDLLDGLKSSY